MRRIALITLVVLFPATSFAQLPNAGEAMGKLDTAETSKKLTEYDFETDEIEGGIIKPLDESIEGNVHRKTPSLIQVRHNFVPELIQSVEDL